MPEVTPYVDTVKIDILKHLASVKTRMDIEMYMAAIMRDKKMKGLYPAAMIPEVLFLYNIKNKEGGGHKLIPRLYIFKMKTLNEELFMDKIEDAMASKHKLRVPKWDLLTW